MTPETQLKKTVKDYLNLKHYFWWWNFASIASYKGLPDIFVLYDNILYGIEFKSPKGKLSDNQIFFMEKLKEYGGVPIIAKKLEDVMYHL